MGGRFAGFRPRNLGEDLGAAHGITRELTSRRSIFVKGLWSSGVQKSTWTILPLGLSGSAKYLRALLEMCNISTNKVEDAPNQLSLQFSFRESVSRFPNL